MKYIRKPDVINIWPFSNIRTWPEHEGFRKLARLLIDRGQTLTVGIENKIMEKQCQFRFKNVVLVISKTQTCTISCILRVLFWPVDRCQCRSNPVKPLL